MAADDRPLVQSLRHAGGLSAAGGKGANLGELIRAGLPVPDGFVVTTAAYDRFVTDNDLADRIAGIARTVDSEAIRGLFDNGTLSHDLADPITEAYAALGGGPVAVRSSATAEDLPGASFAGQQETFLNVTGAGPLLQAIRRCWASLWTARAVAYRTRHGAAVGPLSIAVVIQRLVPAEVSGVLFTANPTNGRRDETLITAAWGLGESVVGGAVDTDTYVVHLDGRVAATIGAKTVMSVATETGSAEVATPLDRRGMRTLTDAQAAELAVLGQRVAEHFGNPQDIEWVWQAGAFQLVQARPITALPDPVGDVPTQWPVPQTKSLYFRASIIEQMPDPLTPLFADMARTAVPQSLNGLLNELAPGLGTLDIDFPTINGYAFYDYSRSTFGRMLSLTPGALKLIVDKGFVLSRWRDRELPRYRASVYAKSRAEPASLSATELLDTVQDLLACGCRYYTTVQTIIPVASMSELTWTALYDKALRRPGDPTATDFLLGFDSTPILAEKALFGLAEWCRSSGDLAEALRTPGLDPFAGDPPAGVRRGIWAEWRKRLKEYLAEFGHTTYNLDFANAVPADDPTPVLQALRHTLDGQAANPSERQRRTAAHRDEITQELLDRLDPIRSALAERALRSAQAWGPVREDGLAAMGLAWPVMRRLLHELGRRLVEAGAIEQVEDVFWLRVDEARSMAADVDSGESLDSQKEVIAQRRIVWRGQKLATPPQYLPESRIMRAMDSMMPARAQRDGRVLKGTSGTGGSVAAAARVLTDPSSFGQFEPGEILVASITTPAYTPLFAVAAGVVTDIGGVLSHGSIVAREYGIPAVLGTGTATKRIRTGDRITVDGGRGQVLLPGGVVDAETKPTAKSARARIAIGVGGVVLAGVGVGLVVHRRQQ